VPQECEIYRVGPGTTQTHNKTMIQYTKRKKSYALFGLGFVEIISSSQTGVFRVFLANHSASTDNLTRTTKRQNTHKRKLTLTQKYP